MQYETLETHYPYSRYLIDSFGAKTYKIVVASHLTCPTRDGTLAKEGCAFCDLRGSSSYFGKQGRGLSVTAQIDARLESVRGRFGADRFLAYFQSYTNTYSDVDYLRGIYTEAATHPAIQGLCIGTRPDCLPDPVIALLEEIAQTTYVSLELGVQSFEDPTLEWLARGHDARCSQDALERLSRLAPHVHTCAHLMFGSPTDTKHAARDAAQILSQPSLKVRGAKLHQLMILENTPLARRWKEHPFPSLSIEQYADVVIEFIENLAPQIYLERLCANATHKDECLAPEWSRERWTPHNRIRDIMAARGCKQGRLVATSDGASKH